MTAWDDACARAEQLGRDQVRRLIDDGADLMVREPKRIIAVLYPFTPWVWPHPDKGAVELLTDCRERLRLERHLALQGLFVDDAALIALRCCEEALVRIIAASGPAIEDAARRVA